MKTTEKISDRVLNMEESATLKMAGLARALRAAGKEVISLSLGEPDFDTPDHIKEAAKKALDDGYTKYTPVPGLLELRKAISNKFKRDNNLDYSENQIVVSNGAKQSLANLSLSLLNPGDEVIILAPYWVSYFEIVRLSGAKPIIIETDISQDFKASPAQLQAALTDKTRFILFSSPCNPTGSVYTQSDLEALAAVIKDREDILVVADEIYEYINFTDKHFSIGSIPYLKDRTITVNGFSKGYAMTGWRLGYIGAPEWVAKACIKIQGQVTSGPNAFAQKAAAYALEAPMDASNKMKATYLKRKELIMDLLSQIDGMQVNHPTGAFYIFPDISALLGKSYQGQKIETDEDFSAFILNEAHVAVVPGSAFGCNGCIRISYAASDAEIIEACKRIKTYVEQLEG
jgi:aspartate aminotransferase